MKNIQLRQITIAIVISILTHAAALLYINVKLPSPLTPPRQLDVFLDAVKPSSHPRTTVHPNSQNVLTKPQEQNAEIPVQPFIATTQDTRVNSEVPVISPQSAVSKTEKIESISSLTRIPTPMRKIQAAYPASERRAGIQSYVLAEVIINAQGIVQDVHILKSGGSAFDTSVIDSLNKTVFTPGYIGDNAVSVRILIPFRFNLN